MKFPGIAVFAFNRPALTERCLAALALNTLASECDLTVYCDGPRAERDIPLIEATRAVAHAAKGFKSINIVSREENLGCANSIIAGITQSLATYDSIAVFEDDILTSQYTISYLMRSLERYERERTVFSISAWSPPPHLLAIPSNYPYDAYFVPRSNIWGWGTWRDRWETIDWAVDDYVYFRKNDSLRNAFNRGGQDLTAMLDQQMAGYLDAWDIRMDYARFKQGCVGLNPVYSYTTNIGMGTGTHTTEFTTRFDNDIAKAMPNPCLPDHIFVDDAILAAYQKVYDPPPLWIRCINKAARMTLGRNLIRH